MTRMTSMMILATGLALGWATGAAAAPEHLTTIERECGKQLRMPTPGCRCMRDRAAKLKDMQQAFVAAVVTRDKAAQAIARQKLTIEELTEAGMFMTNVPAQCR
jgi:hypothetical protein